MVWYKLLAMTTSFHVWQFALKFHCSYNDVYHLKSKRMCDRHGTGDLFVLDLRTCFSNNLSSLEINFKVSLKIISYYFVCLENI